MHDGVVVLVHVDIFTGGVLLRTDCGAALHIDFLLVSSGIFVNGLSDLMGTLLFPGDVTEAFFSFLIFGVGIGDEVGFESIGKYFFVYIISGGHLNSNFIINDIIKPQSIFFLLHLILLFISTSYLAYSTINQLPN